MIAEGDKVYVVYSHVIANTPNIDQDTVDLLVRNKFRGRVFRVMLSLESPERYWVTFEDDEDNGLMFGEDELIPVKG